MNTADERSDYASRKYLAGSRHAEQRRRIYEEQLEKARMFLNNGKIDRTAIILGKILADDPFDSGARKFAEYFKHKTGLDPRLPDDSHAPRDESRLLHCGKCRGILDEKKYEEILRHHFKLFAERGLAGSDETADFMYVMLKLLEEGTVEARSDEHGVFILYYRNERYVLVQPDEADFARKSFDPMHFDRWGLRRV